MDCREGGIVEEYILENAAHNQNSVPELFSIELLTLMKAEPNLDVFLNTWLVSVTTEPGPDGVNTITSAICENQVGFARSPAVTSLHQWAPFATPPLTD